ncbi:putative IMPACT (imprinted ancient) family translation regulator [Variovorax sp. GrIS 2.14]|uniref:hypothetical protein n=1 Tax=Variovorax sp. GrIS 2.14 TaxID=3071709 RepID=UPI0038F7B92A
MTAFTLASPVYSEMFVKKSRFVGCVQPMPVRKAALAVMQRLGDVSQGRIGWIDRVED